MARGMCDVESHEGIYSNFLDLGLEIMTVLAIGDDEKPVGLRSRKACVSWVTKVHSSKGPSGLEEGAPVWLFQAPL